MKHHMDIRIVLKDTVEHKMINGMDVVVYKVKDDRIDLRFPVIDIAGLLGGVSMPTRVILNTRGKSDQFKHHDPTTWTLFEVEQMDADHDGKFDDVL